MDHRDTIDRLIFDLPDHRKNIARYMWTIFTEATNFRISDSPENPILIKSSGLFPISASFDTFISGTIKTVASQYNLPEGLPLFRREEPLACAFYLINSLHESLLSPDRLDKYGRYPYRESIQYANELITTNYVQEIFDDIYQKITGRPVREMKSKLMWSHDIDYLYSAWKTDLIIARRNQQYQKIPGIMWKSILSPHRWNNVDQILKLEKKHHIQSIFFWLTERGKANISDHIYIDHADYSFRMKAVRKLWAKVTKAGSQNGLHKSAFSHSFQREHQKLPDKARINRNHFLKMNVDTHYKKIEKSGLKFDATLGFPEHYGFRNSFGRPFRPYNLQKNRPYQFTEVPLHLMDTTFRTYLNMDLYGMLNKMTEFIDQHSHSCILSILLHNSQYNFRDAEEMVLWKKFYNTLQNIECVVTDKL